MDHISVQCPGEKLGKLALVQCSTGWWGWEVERKEKDLYVFENCCHKIRLFLQTSDMDGGSEDCVKPGQKEL